MMLSEVTVFSRYRRSAMLLPLAAALAMVFGGCAIKPVAITHAQRQARIKHDMKALFQQTEPVKGPLTLYQALARALKYDYNARLKLMQEALANAQLNLSTYNLLPQLTVSAGYHSRSNAGLSTSVHLINGQVTPLEPPTYYGAMARHHLTTNASFTWNILDFGVSYVRAKEDANQVLMFNERKRKVVQNIMQDVREAYWRAYGAQEALPRLNVLLHRVKHALARSRDLQHKQLLSPLPALHYQRSLIDIYQLIIKDRQQLLLAKVRLESLIGVKPGTKLVLAGNGGPDSPPKLHLFDDVDALDHAALNDRPELREADYRKRITVLEAKKALIELLPGLGLTASANHDTNNYLYQNSWSEAGAMVSFNLLRVFSYPAVERTAKAREKVADARRIALSMAVLTQVGIAVERYHQAIVNYRIDSEGADIDHRIERHMYDNVKAKAGSSQMLLRAQVQAALSRMQRYISYAGLQTAYARVANSIGVDLLPPAAQVKDIPTLAKQLASIDAAWRTKGLQSVQSGVAPGAKGGQ